MQIVTEERNSKGNFGRVRNPPYSRIARIIDGFKNQCIYPEDPEFNINMYTNFDAAVFRNVYSDY